MPIRIVCRGCQRNLRISEQLLGKTIACPQCAHRMTLRRPASQTNGAPAAAPQSQSAAQKAVAGATMKPGSGPSTIKPTTRPAPKPAASSPNPPATNLKDTPTPKRLPAAPKAPATKTEVTSSQPAAPREKRTPSGASSSGTGKKPAWANPDAGSFSLPPEEEPARHLPARTAEDSEEKAGSLPAWLSPWGLGGFALGGLGLLLASLTGVRLLTITLAAVGLGIVVLGVWATRKERETKDTIWLSLGGLMAGVVLCLSLFSPGLLNIRWALDQAVVQTDVNVQTRVPRDKPQQEGKPVAPEDWIDASTEALRQDDVVVRVESVFAGDLAEMGGNYLQVHLRLTNSGQVRTIKFEGFGTDKHKPILSDDSGRSYSFVEQWPKRLNAKGLEWDRAGQRFGELTPAGLLDRLLIFQMPPAGVENFKLEVPAAAWGRKGTCKLRIPRDLGN